MPIPETDNILETYGNVISGKNKFKTLLNPLRNAFKPNDFLFINAKQLTSIINLNQYRQ